MWNLCPCVQLTRLVPALLIVESACLSGPFIGRRQKSTVHTRILGSGGGGGSVRAGEGEGSSDRSQNDRVSKQKDILRRKHHVAFIESDQRYALQCNKTRVGR
jgi:hypothetical protein